mgnify:FL=1|jgi:hypothetical protein
MTFYLMNTPRYRIKNRCMFSCLEKDNTNIITSIRNPGYNRAVALTQIANATESGAIKAKTTFVKREIDPQFGRYVGEGGMILSNF